MILTREDVEKVSLLGRLKLTPRHELKMVSACFASKFRNSAAQRRSCRITAN